MYDTGTISVTHCYSFDQKTTLRITSQNCAHRGLKVCDSHRSGTRFEVCDSRPVTLVRLASQADKISWWQTCAPPRTEANEAISLLFLSHSHPARQDNSAAPAASDGTDVLASVPSLSPSRSALCSAARSSSSSSRSSTAWLEMEEILEISEICKIGIRQRLRSPYDAGRESC